MKSPFDRFPKIWILCIAIALSPGQGAVAAPVGSAYQETSNTQSARRQPISVAAPVGSAYQETLTHQKADKRISFYLPPQIESVALQVLSPQTGQWKTLSVKRSPRAGSSNFKVPGRWKNKQLRVLASYNSDSARRTAIPFTANTDSRDITFLTTAGARLFSIEAKIPGADSWTRVSTVAATVQPQTVRVPLPETLPIDAELRVVAVAGSPRPFTGLNAPLTSKILSGPTVFAAIEEVVSGGAMSVISDSPLLRDSMVGTAVVAEEPDIWKIRGHRIYFFNQLRGPQIIDAANRAAPEIVATFSLPAVGEDLYLLGGDASVAGSVVLLTRQPWQSNRSDSTRIISIPLNGDQPAEPSTLDVPGYLLERCLVGQMLHIVSSANACERC